MKLAIYKINSKKNRRNLIVFAFTIFFIFQANNIFKSEKVAAVTNCTSGSVTPVTLSDNRTTILTFTSDVSADGSCTFTVPENVFTVDYLVVAGGGGGNSGGGGAGGLVTSWAVRNQSDSQTLNEPNTPLAVTPGTDIAVTIGFGGRAGSGGAPSNWATTLTRATNGNDSVFGSVRAIGGGAGGFGFGCQGGNGTTPCPGGSMSGAQGGSGGGSAYDFTGTANTASTQTSIVGASSRGNAGGTGGGSGGYRAGSGGGGAGGVGGAPRTTPSDAVHGVSNHQHAGGNGGEGVRSNISGTSNIYSCGGGGGINDNEGNNTARNYGGVNGFGSAGCVDGGRGSNLVVDSRVGTGRNNYFNGTTPVASRGHGGGGTDPESTLAGAGGSGVVIIRYTLPDPACPNSNNSSSATTPIACRATVRIAADGVSVSTFVNGSPVSYVNASNTPTLSIVITPSGLAAEVSGGQIAVSAPIGSSLAGGTYPLIYRITEGANTSDAVLMVNVTDPGQRTPVVVLVDPRATQVDLPAILVGDISATLVCVTPRSASGAYSNNPTVSSTQEVPGITTTPLSSGGVRFTGNNTNMTTQVGSIRVTAFGTERLLAEDRPRFLDVNVSNTATGGNNSCSGGTESSIELRPLGVDMTILKGTLGLKN
jgi:hypothetical protein